MLKSYHQAAGAQLRLFSATDEAECYHSDQSHGFFALLMSQGPGKRNIQSSHRLSDMPIVLGLLDRHHVDTWLSQAEFLCPNRRVVNLARLSLLFADLDTYKIDDLKARTPDQLVSAVLKHCADEGIPLPSLLVFSGRGIQAKWFLDKPIPRQALPRWNACQKHLVDALDALGADRQARDASRVLRLINTVNTKSGEICRVVHVESGPDGKPISYAFEQLADVLLPQRRSELERERVERKERRANRLALVEDTGRNFSGLHRFSGRKLAWDRLEDLRRLVELRGGVQEGERMLHLFWQLDFLLLSGATNSRQMYHEAAALARALDASWGYSSHELMTLYAKARAYESGQKVTFGGHEYSPLYTPHNDTLINIFRITDAEQRQLRTIISQQIAAERHAQRERERRRQAGAIDRASYLETAANKAVEARLLRAQGLSVRAIAQKMGVSAGAVAGYLKS